VCLPARGATYDWDSVIPTVLIAGAVVGRWWFVAVAALAWAVLVVATGDASANDFVAAFGFGAANAAVGIATHRVVAGGVRAILSLRPRRGA
jgi:hypothetical protein